MVISCQVSKMTNIVELIVLYDSMLRSYLTKYFFGFIMSCAILAKCTRCESGVQEIEYFGHLIAAG